MTFKRMPSRSKCIIAIGGPQATSSSWKEAGTSGKACRYSRRCCPGASNEMHTRAAIHASGERVKELPVPHAARPSIE